MTLMITQQCPTNQSVILDVVEPCRSVGRFGQCVIYDFYNVSYG